VSKTITQMTRKKESTLTVGNYTGNIAHCEVPNKQGWTTGTNFHLDLLDLLFHPVDRAGCLEHQFTPDALCDENHEQQVEGRIQALLEAEDNYPP
jgi:hypothetical protein